MKMTTHSPVKMLLIVLLVFVNLPDVENRFVRHRAESYCYSKDEIQQQHEMFSSKTAYEIIRPVSNDFEFTVANCKPIQFWMLSRHGTRLPSASSMEDLANLVNLRDEIIDNHEIKGELCAEDLENLKNWRWDYNITPDHDQYLVPQGYRDLKYLAERYQGRFPDLLTPPYSESDYNFRHTDTERTKRSAEAFAESLFGANIDIPEPPEIDTLLRPYDHCPRWEKQEYKDEHNKFIQSDVYQDMMRKISTRLGFDDVLSEDQVESIWDMCRYNLAWELEETSPWCAAFTLDHVKILEYKEDLKYNYKSGFGNEFNREVGCGVVKDLIDTFQATIDGLPSRRVTAYFSHSTMLTLMKTALGIGEDPEPLRADAFLTSDNRNFRMSELDAFANNIVAVLYQCDSSEINEHVVVFFHNESLIKLDACEDGICSWGELWKKFGSTAESCSMDSCYENL